MYVCFDDKNKTDITDLIYIYTELGTKYFFCI